MLLLGVELQDVLRVVIGVALGLLTCYRRELSCNRGYYHPPSDNENNYHDDPPVVVMDAQGSQHSDSLSGRERNGCKAENIISRNSSRRGLIRRRNSSSALPNMIASVHHEDDDDNDNHHRGSHSTNSSSSSSSCTIHTVDVTEELLESAGLSLSGGPFLYMAIAMFDHLVLTTYLTTFASVSSILHRLKSKMDARPNMRSHPPLSRRHQHDNNNIMATTRLHYSESSSDAKIMQRAYLYSVAWNAATEYFTSISTKLETQQKQQQQQQQNIRNYPSNDTRYSKSNTAASPRSKSTGNLFTLASSDDDIPTSSSSHSRAIFRDVVATANVGGLDVTILPGDAQIVLFSHLPPRDILSFACTNRAALSLLDDGTDEVVVSTSSSVDAGEGKIGRRPRSGNDDDGDTPLLIWKALFHRDYSWVLMDWDVGKDAFLRSATAFIQRGRRRDPKSRKIFRHLTSSIDRTTDSERSATTTSWPILEDGTSGDALASIYQPVVVASMKEFYFTFAEVWLNYTIAGCISPADRCLIGLHGHVFDITNFVEDHPGSTETLLLQAGRDATVFFESMGHSSGARKLALGMCVVVDGQCVRWDGIPGGGDGELFPRNAAGQPASNNFAPWGLAKPTHRSLTARRNMLGFLLPRRRSSPRFQGGLHRIRERLRQEEEIELNRAAQWGLTVLGTDGMFGGVHVYFDPFCGWRWWYTDRDFNAVFVTPPPTS